MPPKRAKQGVVRKVNIIKPNEGKGIYSFLLYSNLDRTNRAVFKIGQTTVSFAKRVEAYHGYVPNGVWIMALLKNPTKKRQPRWSQTMYYEKVEEYCFQKVREFGGQFIWSTTRIKKDRNVNNEGRTEFIYCSPDQLKRGFQATQEEFGGQLTMYDADGVNKENAALKRTSANLYVGESLYKLQPETGGQKRMRVGFEDDY